MASKDEIIRIRHMLEASKDALSFIQNKNRSALDTDKLLSLSLVRCIEIIGEAASKLSKETYEKFPQIPWKNIISMRNRLIHAYYDINLNTVWSTITEDLPPLVAELERILQAPKKP